MCVGKKNNHEIACWIIIASVLVVTVVDFSNSSRTKMACQNLFSFSPYYLYEYGVAGNNFYVTIQVLNKTNKTIIIVSILVFKYNYKQ